MVLKYSNPIVRGMRPDPSVVVVDDTYYLVNSTFEYYPGMSVSKSNDLLNWKDIGGVATDYKQADLRTAKSNEGIFAANIRYHDGYFYVITTNFAEFKTFIIRGKLQDNTINWEDSRVEIDVPGIDPDIYFENGRSYVQFTGYIDDKGTKAIRQVEIDLKTGEILDGPKILTYGTGGRDVEGPHIFKKDGYYYLLVAEGGTGQGHMITIFRSKNLWGPYESEEGINPIFSNRDRATEPIQNVGHGDLFKDVNGNWWLVCLGTRPADIGFKQITNLGRETLLYPVVWKNDWPVVNNGVPTKEVDLTEFPEHAKALTNSQELTDFKDDFSNNTLSKEWLSLRNTLGSNINLKDKQLHLYGNNHLVSELTTPAFLGLRQKEHQEDLIVKVDPKLSRANQGAFGIVSLIDADNHCAVLVDEDKNVIIDQQIFDVKLNQAIGKLSSYPVEFKLINKTDKKIFSVIDENGKEVTFATDAIHLSNEAIAALNTGDIEGLYVTKNAEMVVNEVSQIRK